MTEERHGRGLQAIEQSREARGKIRWPSTKFWGWAGLILVVSAILNWKWSQGRLESQRSELMARQRAVATELGPRWLPLQDRIEGWTMELAKEPGAEIADQEALKAWEFRDKPGIYLRLTADQGTSVESIRKGARDSLRDAFTACLMRASNPNPLAGAECKRTRECQRGEFCNELDRCTRPAQPYNLRVAYRALRVLTDEWVNEVQEVTTDLRLRVLAGSFDDTTQDDLPVAIDLLARAQYFLLVLDEIPTNAALPATDAGSLGEAIQAVPHHARIGIWRLSDGKAMLRLRREASGQLLGATPMIEADVMAARQQQTNSCALALAVRLAMGDKDASVVPPQ
jgi:hypothetical protein